MTLETKPGLQAARAALKERNPALALDITGRLIKDRPAFAAAYLVRAEAHYRVRDGLMGMCALLDGLAIEGIPPPLLEKFGAQLLLRLRLALDTNWLEIEAVIHAADLVRKVPAAAATAKLLALINAHDTEAALAFAAGLTAPEHSAVTVQLTSRLLLNACRIDEALALLAGHLEGQQEPIYFDENLAAMAEYRENRLQGLRDRSIFPPRYKLAICAALKNEADDLAEWVAHHAALGVEAFYLYDNDSTDATPAILDALSERYTIIRHKISAQPAQALAYRHFFQVHRFEAEWVAMIDGDEFINPVAGNDLQGLLDRGEDCAGIAINWAIFGSSGLETKPEGLCIEAFNRRGADGHAAHAYIKSIVRPHRVVRYSGPHQQLLFGHYEDPEGNRVFPLAKRVYPPRLGLVRLHHYAIKSREQSDRKLARGRPIAAGNRAKFRDQSYVEWNDINEVDDTSMHRFAPAVRAALSEIRVK